MPPYGGGPYYDELGDRRRERMSEEGEAEEKPPQFGALDILAMIIAAYQVLLPILAVFLGAMVVIYLLFRLLFT